MLLASKSIEEINRLKAQMARTFDMKDLGAARQILGMETFRDRSNDKLWLSQQKYVEKILLRFGDLDKRRSTSGYVFTLAGGAISWMLKLQNIFALSTTEAEYIAASHACKEAIWLKGLFGEFGRLQDNIKLFCDSQSAIHLAKNPAYRSKSKDIPIKYHFVRQVITERGVSLEKVHTKENFAEMFTKPILLEKLHWCLASLGLQKRLK
eukprot:PITA_21690